MKTLNTDTFLNAKDAKDAKSAKGHPNEQPNFENDFSSEVIGAAVEVQRILGVGLLESAYANALAIELKERELAFVQEAPIQAFYKGYDLGLAYRADFVVEGSLVLEIKAISAVNDVHRAQLLSYLRTSGHRLGLLINFHAYPVAKSIHRLVNNP